ncbi:hypothetical protein NECID01_0052 [Nematocida sp. AWRm77]|nr:hypothetical protein NECID01_0052 [Nematocida sp. AWRm77]
MNLLSLLGIALCTLLSWAKAANPVCCKKVLRARIQTETPFPSSLEDSRNTMEENSFQNSLKDFSVSPPVITLSLATPQEAKEDTAHALDHDPSTMPMHTKSQACPRPEIERIPADSSTRNNGSPSFPLCLHTVHSKSSVPNLEEDSSAQFHTTNMEGSTSSFEYRDMSEYSCACFSQDFLFDAANRASKSLGENNPQHNHGTILQDDHADIPSGFLLKKLYTQDYGCKLGHTKPPASNSTYSIHRPFSLDLALSEPKQPEEEGVLAHQHKYTFNAPDSIGRSDSCNSHHKNSLPRANYIPPNSCEPSDVPCTSFHLSNHPSSPSLSPFPSPSLSSKGSSPRTNQTFCSRSSSATSPISCPPSDLTSELDSGSGLSTASLPEEHTSLNASKEEAGPSDINKQQSFEPDCYLWMKPCTPHGHQIISNLYEKLDQNASNNIVLAIDVGGKKEKEGSGGKERSSLYA